MASATPGYDISATLAYLHRDGLAATQTTGQHHLTPRGSAMVTSVIRYDEDCRDDARPFPCPDGLTAAAIKAIDFGARLPIPDQDMAACIGLALPAAQALPHAWRQIIDPRHVSLAPAGWHIHGVTDTHVAAPSPDIADLQRDITLLLPHLHAHLAATGLTPICDTKARVLLAVYLTTRIADDIDDGHPLSRTHLASILGAPVDVHPGQLSRAGWIHGDHSAGYTISAKGHALCHPLDSHLAASPDDLTGADQPTEADPPAPRATATTPSRCPRDRWRIEQAAGPIARADTIGHHAAHLVALWLNLADDSLPHRDSAWAHSPSAAAAALCQAAASTLQLIIADGPTDREVTDLCALLDAIPDAIPGLDWRAITTSATNRFA
jgi:hypothetical protein